MTVFTEAAHTAEFILSEGNGHISRESGTLVSGQNLAAGTVVQLNGAGKLTAFTGITNSAGSVVTPAVGVLLSAVDASGGDKPAAYIARNAEVNFKQLTYAANKGTETKSSLKSIGIIARD